MQQPDTPHVDSATARRLAVEASCDPRSIQKEISQPGSVKGEAGHRIRRVLTARRAASTTT